MFDYMHGVDAHSDASLIDTPMPVTSFTVRKQDRYLGCLRSGMRRGASARAAGTTPQTISAYQREHPEFVGLVEQAEEDACDPIEDAVYRKACEGSLGHAVFWLTNRSMRRWADRRNLPPVQIITNPTESPEDMRRKLAELLRETKEPDPDATLVNGEQPTQPHTDGLNRAAY